MPTVGVFGLIMVPTICDTVKTFQGQRGPTPVIWFGFFPEGLPCKISGKFAQDANDKKRIMGFQKCENYPIVTL